MLKIKRIYESPEDSDGYRILIDRLWPRGLSKDKAKVDLWLKDIAPGDTLRKWFNHEPKKWAEFKQKYFEELKVKKEMAEPIIQAKNRGTVTLLYGAKEEKFNNAVALKEYIETKIKK